MLAMEGPHIRPNSPQWRRPIQAAGSTTTTTPLQHEKSSRGLPPTLNFLDLEKIKRETIEYHDKHQSPVAVTHPSAPPLVSPQSMHSGPPPPYSYPSSATSSILGLAGYASPPGSRRHSDDDKERPSTRQSLPSIHEALGKDQSILYSGPPASATVHAHMSHTSSVHSPTTPIPRSHPEPVLSGPPNPYAPAQSLPPYSNESSDRKPSGPVRQTSQNEDQGPASVTKSNPRDPNNPQMHANTPPTPTAALRQSPHMSHPSHPSSMYPPSTQPISQQSNYRPFPPAYSYPPAAASTIAYQPQFPAPQSWRSDGMEAERAEEVRKAASKRSPGSGQHYGESVKRHLDIFDLETSLNEIAEGSGRALEFSRHFGARAHQHQRSGSSSAMPTLVECEEMIRRQTTVLDAMSRIREVVVAQQQALAEQRNRDEANKTHQLEYREDAAAYQDKSEGGGGFAGSDAKKRKGRNAPPGRCHSCNRAETPEWRRGPDGARTLCNACGLHFAKLTRKLGSKATAGSSNLRPKEAESLP